jgi:hypothetical protein
MELLQLSKCEQITLPQLQLLVAFLCSTFLILPLIFSGNLVGILTFSLIVIFYLISELQWLKATFKLNVKQIFFNLLLISLSGYLAFEVFFLLGVLAFFPIIKFYKWP